MFVVIFSGCPFGVRTYSKNIGNLSGLTVRFVGISSGFPVGVRCWNYVENLYATFRDIGVSRYIIRLGMSGQCQDVGKISEIY